MLELRGGGPDDGPVEGLCGSWFVLALFFGTTTSMGRS